VGRKRKRKNECVLDIKLGSGGEIFANFGCTYTDVFIVVECILV